MSFASLEAFLLLIMRFFKFQKNKNRLLCC